MSFLASIRNRLFGAHTAAPPVPSLLLETERYGIFRARRDGVITGLNSTAEELLGFSASELVGRATPVVWLDPDELRKRAEALSRDLNRDVHEGFETLLAAVDAARATETEWTVVRKDGARFSAIITLTVSRSEHSPNGYVGVIEDCTAQKQHEAKLRWSLVRAELALAELEQYKRALDQHAIVVVTDSRGVITFANDHFCRASGFARDELLGRTHRVVASGQHERALFTSLWAAISRGEVWRGELCNRSKSGGLRWFATTISPVNSDSGGIDHFVAVYTDISDLRKSHERIRELAERLASVRERERRAMAVSLHEGVAQDLYAAQLSLSVLASQAKGRTGVSELATELQMIVDGCIRDLKSLTDDLYPTALTHLTLLDALRDHAGHFARRSGLTVTVRESGVVPEPDAATKILFFRAAQEALTNTARHAQANAAAITLVLEAGRITMTVADDGIGISTADLSKVGSLGLLGMRERFEAVGGGVRIAGVQPKGAMITVFAPHWGR